ncbi:Rep protein [Staphylococcus haemolyticus]|uniref:Rep protein n=1 Tax=Staphylococcus haemolyticus TaxID=1283 RepID=UPI0028A50E39|nr:Rep protein [Staphylococcus haemolyticus]MDT3947995.1 Rep protein [Staphylococcus haemolyticus]
MVSYNFYFATEPQIFYVWNQKEYLASEIYDLTEEEKREVNNQMINEIEEE